MKVVENLFPELCNIYGESYSVEYLSRCNGDIKLVQTNHKDVPAFVTEDVDMVYLGCSSERKQEQIIEILKPYKARIKELIDKGTIFLATGNAIEVFGKSIKDEDRVIEALGLFEFDSVRYMEAERHNSQYVGSFKADNGPITMLGHRSQFSFAYGDFENFPHWLDIEIGIGMNKETKREGIHYNNFFATYSLGPCLIMNPLFAKYLLRLMDIDDSLLFENEIMEAYEYRKHELRENLANS
ncbi:MAG: hypothetical protein MJ145_00920 [Clostridia bacterium]|nr:hypothetical protein [Clostridia bacterium]